jgi:hypothetical protein
VRNASTSLERLTPLIHELIVWDLIYRTDEGDFKLREDLQRLLAERIPVSPPSPPEVFVGRKCQRCLRMAVTRMVDGSRICGSCGEALGRPVTADHSDVPVVAPESRARTHWRRRGHRLAG